MGSSGGTSTPACDNSSNVVSCGPRPPLGLGHRASTGCFGKSALYLGDSSGAYRPPPREWARPMPALPAVLHVCCWLLYPPTQPASDGVPPTPHHLHPRLETGCCRWTAEEDAFLQQARLANPSLSIRGLAGRLTASMPNRSVEALFKRISLLSSTPPPETCPVDPPPPTPPLTPPPQECDHPWRDDLFEALRPLTSLPEVRRALPQAILDANTTSELLAQEEAVLNIFTVFCAAGSTPKPITPSNARCRAFKGNRRKVRRQQYASTQSLWRKSRSDAAALVLSGRWRRPRGAAFPDGMRSYWSEVLSTPSTPDTRPVTPATHIWSLLSPVTPLELRTTLRAMRGSAPGPDGRTADDLLKMPALTLALVLLYQLFLPVVPALNSARHLRAEKGRPRRSGRLPANRGFEHPDAPYAQAVGCPLDA